jgi:hypothetical protein
MTRAWSVAIDLLPMAWWPADVELLPMAWWPADVELLPMAWWSTGTSLVPLAWDVQFSHQGLATATLWLGIATTLTGALLLWYRYGHASGSIEPTLTRWIHIVLGVALLCYLLGTYLIVPV